MRLSLFFYVPVKNHIPVKTPVRYNYAKRREILHDTACDQYLTTKIQSCQLPESQLATRGKLRLAGKTNNHVGA